MMRFLLTSSTLLLWVVLQTGCATSQVSSRTATPKIPRAEPQKPMAQKSAPETTAIEVYRPAIPEPLALPEEPGQSPEFQESPAVSAPPAEVSAPASQEIKQPTVVANLMSAANRFESEGDFARAAASIERGLRISPKNASLWQRLAEIRLQQRQLEQAELTAKKSNALARGNRVLMARNWEIIASSRQLRGDLQGAEFARAKALQFRP